MKTNNQNSSSKTPKKSVKYKSSCDNCKKIPSEQNCSKCSVNMIEKLIKDTFENENLSSDEKVAKFQIDLDNLILIPTKIFQALQTILVRKIKKEHEKQIEHEKQKLALAEKIKLDDLAISKEKEPKIVREKIPIIGNKYDVGQKIGFFFFNPENEDGLNLPKIHVDAVIESFCESYKPIKGKDYSSRYLFDNVNAGANKNLTRKIKKARIIKPL